MVTKENQKQTAGARFRAALREENPLQVIGTINAYAAILAEEVGFRAIYLSGAGVANGSYGLPDLAVTSCKDVLEDVYRITYACSLPLLVDADTGWGDELGIGRTVKQMIRAGAAGIHIEDQQATKRCGHRPDKRLVSVDEMVNRVKTAVDARTDPSFIIMARSDALANEGMHAMLDRMAAYVAAGADMLFAEAVTTLEEYTQIARTVSVPVLANITEFGRTPLFTVDELAQAGVSMALYPLSAFRAMNAAALNVYRTIRSQGTQKNVVSTMQTREDLYTYLNYHEAEDKLNK